MRPIVAVGATEEATLDEEGCEEDCASTFAIVLLVALETDELLAADTCDAEPTELAGIS